MPPVVVGWIEEVVFVGGGRLFEIVIVIVVVVSLALEYMICGDIVTYVGCCPRPTAVAWLLLIVDRLTWALEPKTR